MNSQRTTVPAAKALFAMLSAAVCVPIIGCGIQGGGATTGATNAPPATHYTGSVYGGQQPVVGATIQLYTVGTLGNGSTATPLIASTVTTDANGNFNISGAYSCSSATEVYLVATGGNAGQGANSAISLMAALGQCSSLNSSTFILMNELTTVAAAYALSPFMTSYQQVGGNGPNPSGLVNAFNMSQVLVKTSNGQLGTTPGMTLPAAELNTLADILAMCVNSAGPSSSACTTLFNATSATDTIGAALAIAQAPGNPVMTALWSLPSGTPPFVPGLSAQPNDFSVAVKYSGSELKAPWGIAIDATGNAWATNEAGASIVKLPAFSTSFATTTYSSGGLLAARGVSIDRTGNVWVANTGGNDVVELSSTGAVLSSTGYTGGSISAPVAIANDSAGNAWVANVTGNSITELGPSGVASGTSPITSSLSAPSSIAIDSTGRVVVANQGNGSVCFFANAGTLQECSNDGTLFGATAVAVTASGSVTLAGSTTGASVAGAFTLANTSGTVDPASPVAGGGLTLPTAVAYDGAGTAWFANTASVSAFSGENAISGSKGYNAFNTPMGIAVDGSGNVWVTGSGDNSVSVLVGIASPVTTPLAANVGP